jgi:hypothetical protein
MYLKNSAICVQCATFVETLFLFMNAQWDKASLTAYKSEKLVVLYWKRDSKGGLHVRVDKPTMKSLDSHCHVSLFYWVLSGFRCIVGLSITGVHSNIQLYLIVEKNIPLYFFVEKNTQGTV